jgi:hypothetical protein
MHFILSIILVLVPCISRALDWSYFSPTIQGKFLEPTQGRFLFSVDLQSKSITTKESVYKRQLTWNQLQKTEAFKSKNIDQKSKLQIQSVDQNEAAINFGIDVEKSKQSLNFGYEYGITQDWRILFSFPLSIQKTTLTYNKKYISSYAALNAKGLFNEEEEARFINQSLNQKNYNEILESQVKYLFQDVAISSFNKIMQSKNLSLQLINSIHFPLESAESKYDIFYDPNLESTLNYEIAVSSNYFLYKNIHLNLSTAFKYHFENKLNLMNEKNISTQDNKKVMQKKSIEKGLLVGIGFSNKRTLYNLGLKFKVQAKTKYSGTSELNSSSNKSKVNNQIIYAKLDFDLNNTKNSSVGIEFSKDIKSLEEQLDEGLRLSFSQTF